MSRVGILVSCSLLVLLVLAPVGTMVVESFRVGEVIRTDGTIYRGQILDEDEDYVRIRPRDVGRTREIVRADVAFSGRVFGFDNYEGILSGQVERNMLMGTVALAGVSTLLAFLIGFPLGILLG